MGSCNTLSMTLACKRHVIPDVCTCNQPLRISTFGYHPCLSFTRISINQVWSSPLLPLQLTSRLVLFHNLSSCSDLEFRILSLCPHAWLYFCCRFPHLSLLTILTPPPPLSVRKVNLYLVYFYPPSTCSSFQSTFCRPYLSLSHGSMLHHHLHRGRT